MIIEYIALPFSRRPEAGYRKGTVINGIRSYLETSRAGTAALYLIPAVLALVIYGQTIHFQYNIDDHLVTQPVEEVSGDLDGFMQLLASRYNLTDYRPVTFASFFLERSIAGDLRPGWSHAVNLGLYVIILWLIAAMVARIPGTAPPTGFLIALFTALLFCAHPIHANVVSSVKSRDTLLSMVFLLSAMVALFGMIRPRMKWYHLPAFILFSVLAFYSKRDAVGMILVAPLTILLFRPDKWKLAALCFLVWLGIIQSFSVRSLWAPVAASLDSVDAVRFSENPMGDDFRSRMFAAFSTYWLYLKMYFVPKGYCFYFGYDAFAFPFSGRLLIASIAVSLGSLLFAIYAWMRHKLPAFALLFGMVHLIYCLNYLSSIAGIVAPRLAFISSLGFCLLVVAMIIKIPARRLSVAVLTVLIAGLSWLSFERSRDWKDSQTIIRADLPQLENSHGANRIAGLIYMNIADTARSDREQDIYYALAQQHLEQADAIYSGNWQPNYHLGLVYVKQGQPEKGIPYLKKSLALMPIKDAVVAEQLGDACYLVRDLACARKNYRRAWQLDSGNQELISKISTTYYDAGQLDSLYRFNDSLIAYAPELFAPYENYGYLHLNRGDSVKAAEFFRQAVLRGLEDGSIEALIRRTGTAVPDSIRID